jgi:hypothetical protein
MVASAHHLSTAAGQTGWGSNAESEPVPMTSLDLIADHAALRWELLGLTDELTAIGTDPGGTS